MNKRFHLTWIKDWEIFDRSRQWNWESFHLIHCYVERDNVCRTLEISAALLGIGFTIIWYPGDRVFPENAARDRARELADQWLAEQEVAD